MFCSSPKNVQKEEEGTARFVASYIDSLYEEELLLGKKRRKIRKYRYRPGAG